MRLHEASPYPLRGKYRGTLMRDVPANILLHQADGMEGQAVVSAAGRAIIEYVRFRRPMLERQALEDFDLDKKRRAGRRRKSR